MNTTFTELVGGDAFVSAWMGLAVVSMVSLLFIDAPYGRHQTTGWGPTTSARLGWVIMETPALLIMAGLFIAGDRFDDVALWIYVLMWCIHYFHRSWIYPCRARIAGKTMPLAISGMGAFFQTVNSTLNGEHLFLLERAPGQDWLSDPRLWIGLAIFILGMICNIHSDTVLLNLRKDRDVAAAAAAAAEEGVPLAPEPEPEAEPEAEPESKSESAPEPEPAPEPEAGGGYVIPRGGMFRYVSAPNYLGEMMEWLGFAIATWSLTGLSFFVWTVANLGPRAFANHRWYKNRFPDYPPERRALIPCLC